MGQSDYSGNINNADNKLVDLMFVGLDHGIESVKASGPGPLIPFVMVETNGKRNLKRYVSERLEDGLDEGMRELENDNDSEFAVLVYDGYLTIDGVKFDAVIVKGFDRKDKTGYQIGQRYERKSFLKPFKVIGNAAYLGTVEQLLK